MRRVLVFALLFAVAAGSFKAYDDDYYYNDDTLDTYYDDNVKEQMKDAAPANDDEKNLAESSENSDSKGDEVNMPEGNVDEQVEDNIPLENVDVGDNVPMDNVDEGFNVPEDNIPLEENIPENNSQENANDDPEARAMDLGIDKEVDTDIEEVQNFDEEPNKKDYEDLDTLIEPVKNDEDDSQQQLDKKDNDDVPVYAEKDAMDLKVEKDIKKFLNQDDTKQENEDNTFDDTDYQVEDNRSSQEDKLDIGVEQPKPLSPELRDEQPKEILQEAQELINEDSESHIDVGDEEVGEQIAAVNEEALNEDNQVDAENKEESLPSAENVENVEENKDDNVDEDEQIDSSEIDDETVQKAFDELKDDMDSLFETIDKLAESGGDVAASDEDIAKGDARDYEEKYDKVAENDEDIAKDDVRDYDEKYDKVEEPNEEIAKDNVRDYEENDEKDAEPDEEIAKENVRDYEEKYDRPFNEETILRQREDYYDEVDGDSDKLFEDVADDAANEDKKEPAVPVPYGDDAIVETQNNEEKEKMIENPEADDTIDEPIANLNNNEGTNEDQPLDNAEANIPEDHPVEDLPAEELSSAELNDMMTQFAVEHSDDLDVNAENFDRNIAPVFITLKHDEVTVIESPNYPKPYPTNNIIDWVIDGEGHGIEMNVTDLAVNGFSGDYLLVKPGGIDESGHDGLVFSYQLRRERKYRFLDVDRIFIRFEAKRGFALPTNRGFSISAKMILPPRATTEPAPEPEAQPLQPPRATTRVHLSGLTKTQFQNVTEDFRLLVADMATMYIAREGLEAGETDTAEVTQITGTSSCNQQWPGAARCLAVHFGVPLDGADDEENTLGLTERQLEEMWRRYVEVDPFKTRLRRMGLEEYQVPSTTAALAVWLVLGSGAALAAGLLAVLLWRWSCMEDYTRMGAYSDTDSVFSEKRALDLYPTPHQAIPPLYDPDYPTKQSDTTRVDLGGLANKSYTRDMFELDSDEEMTGPEDRSSSFQPKDIYSA
ncbi:probable serine/threonine-protein kinase kinX [Plutella xylostella]|uniref:probable serine/threonine-protein kinase kinX n=1 Tax=Plutella xylostella TaxID=51655 RepID=UPI0020326BBC|nr:probable serine/threonine-protein kinase kinX [Plutella xylostella]